MKVSGDLIVKLGLGVAVLGAIGLVMWRIKSMAPAVVAAVNPADPNNLANQAVGAIGGALVSSPTGPGKNADGSWSLGGWMHDVINPSTAQAVRDMSGPVQAPEPAIPRDPYDFIFGRKAYVQTDGPWDNTPGIY